MNKFSYIFISLFSVCLLFPQSGTAQTSQDTAVCAKAASCPDMGFTMTAAQCSGKASLKCPFDQTKYFCNDGIVGEVRIFAGSSIPKGWKLLNSNTQQSSITYKNLYSVIGYTFGGNSTSFQLPNLTSRFVIGANSSYYLGKTGGAATHTLTINEMPSHKHVGPWGENTKNYSPPYGAYGSNRPGSNDNDNNNAWHKTSFTGGSQAHNNMPPYTTIRYIMFTGKY